MEIFDSLEKPSIVEVETEEQWFRLHPDPQGWEHKGIRVALKRKGQATDVELYADHVSVKRVRLRWNQPTTQPVLVLTDHWERSYGDLEWRGIVPERILPWYFMLNDGPNTYGLGVKTGANAMCFWQFDPQGITLCLDVRNGGMGVQLNGRNLEMASIVSYFKDGQSAFRSAQDFCKVMCDQPVLPSFPVYGGNNWYHTYGFSSHEEIMEETQFISSLATSNVNRPFMVIDDGWQLGWSRKTYNGGPWRYSNSSFPDMSGLASQMKQVGTRPGIWLRPLLTNEKVPDGWKLHQQKEGYVLDPSIPEVLDYIASEVKTMTAWGYELFKHDFTTFDIFQRWGPKMGYQLTDDGWCFSDRSKTTAEIVKELYRAISDAAGQQIVIGCNTIGHLAAGIVHLQRTGDDVSGVSWEKTRRRGVNTLAFRMPQHDHFFAIDADCVCITDHLPWEFNQNWLELLSLSGTPLFISADMDAVGAREKKAIQTAFERAAVPRQAGEPVDWLQTTSPSQWNLDGKPVEYDWYGNKGVDFQNWDQLPNYHFKEGK